MCPAPPLPVASGNENVCNSQIEIFVQDGASLGDRLTAEGDLNKALTIYQLALSQEQRFYASNPDASTATGLSIAYRKVADTLKAQGDLAGALTRYQEALEMSQRITDQSASNMPWQRHLYLSHVGISEILKLQGDLAGALSSQRMALDISQRLHEMSHPKPR
jgi:tetratricopeptide (TPR) repeat protein